MRRSGREDAKRRHGTPLAYLITFTTYGVLLHGDERGSVDRDHRVYGTPLRAPDGGRLQLEAGRLKHPAVRLTQHQREIVDQGIRKICEHRDWTLHAVSVRTNHVHVVVSAPQPPETVMNQLKSWSTRKIREAGLREAGTKSWTRHGSTRYLWQHEHLLAACRYVMEGQGVEQLDP